MIRAFITTIILYSGAYAQDTTWQQVLGGWVDDVYYENLFIGGTYWTRIALGDIDDDGDLDMFYGGGDCGSLVYFENIGNSANPIFEFRYEEFPGLKHPSWIRGAANADFADLDNDGDLDAAFSPQIDAGGMVFWNDGNAVNANFIYRPPYGSLQGQSSVTLVDIDNDGDYDYFSGHGNNDFDIFFAENMGTIYEPDFVVITQHYQDISTWGTFNFDFGDLDLDGDYDLIMCKWGGTISYYENTGTPDSASLTLITDDLIPLRSYIEWMEAPELGDMDGDGDLDLFLAGNDNHLFYFENRGMTNMPQFELVYDTSFFYTIPTIAGTWLKNSVDIDGDGDDDIAPGRSLFLNESFNGELRYTRVDDMLPFVSGNFADMDADGDYDYLISGGNGTIRYFENVNDSTWPVWGDRVDLFPPDGRLQFVYTVAAGDLNGDGTIDLLIGHEGSGFVDYYQNNGSPEVPDIAFAGSLSLPQWDFRGYFYCVLEDVDNDNDLDLFIGESRIGHVVPVRLLFYRNDGTPTQPSWTYITDDFQNVISEHRNESIVPCFSDADNDGDRDFITSAHLGLMLFLNPEIQTDIYENPHAPDMNPDRIFLSCYPNPFNSEAVITVDIGSQRNLELSVYNILGQKIETVFSGFRIAGLHRFYWNPDQLSAGFYFLRLSSDSQSRTQKLLYLK